MKDITDRFGLNSTEYDLPSISGSDVPAELKPEYFRLSEDDADLGVIEEGDGSPTVTVQQPPKGIFVRIHPDPKYRLITGLLLHPKTRELYLVVPQIFRQLDEELKMPACIFFGVTQDQDLFLWPVKLRNAEYAASGVKAAEQAMEGWVRISLVRFKF